MCCRLQKLLLLYLLNLQHTLIPYLQGTFFRGQKSTTPHRISWIAWIFSYIGGIYLRLYGFNLYNFQNKCMATRQHRNKLQRPGAIWIHDTGCYVLFLFSDSREQRQSIGMLYMDFKNRMLRPFIWCVQRDYSIYALWCESFFQTSRCDLENCSSSLILYPNYWLVAFWL